MTLKKWNRPVGRIEAFSANDYVSACGDHGTVYKFECNAGDPEGHYDVFLNGKDGIAGTDDDIKWSESRHKWFHPCGITHEASVSDDFEKGYMYACDRSLRIYPGTPRIDVVVWTDGGKQTHCTTKLNQSDWETDRS